MSLELNSVGYNLTLYIQMILPFLPEPQKGKNTSESISCVQSSSQPNWTEGAEGVCYEQYANNSN